MAASLGDLIQIVDNQTYLGESLLNVYYYRVTSITGLSEPYLEALADWFTENVVEEVRRIQNQYLTHTVLQVRNLSNNLDFYEDPIQQVGYIGVAPDGALPSWMTVNFKLVRESLATRNGSKRYSGLVESLSAGNAYSLTEPQKEAISAVLAEDILLGVVTVAEPVIVRRPIDPPVGTSYTYASIGSALYTKFGTQNTRKP